MPFTDGQDVAVSHLLKELKHEYDSKDQKLMKRKPSIIKAHMLIVARAWRGSLDASGHLGYGREENRRHRAEIDEKSFSSPPC